MPWFVLALLAALLGSFVDIGSKQASRSIDPMIVSWSWTLFSLPILIPLALYIGIPPLAPSFWPALAIASLLFAMNSVLYVWAITGSDLSLTTPIANFAPVFILFVTGPLVLNELPTWIGAMGVFLIVAGTYTLNVSSTRKGLSAPLRAILVDRGPRLMLLVAFSFSVTAAFEKRGILNSSPIFWVAAQHTVTALVLLPVVAGRKSRQLAHAMRNHLKVLVAMGALLSLLMIVQSTALASGQAAYVIAIKRCGILLSVVAGWRLFGEGSIKERFAGTAIMLVGVAVIATQ